MELGFTAHPQTNGTLQAHRWHITLSHAPRTELEYITHIYSITVCCFLFSHSNIMQCSIIAHPKKTTKKIMTALGKHIIVFVVSLSPLPPMTWNSFWGKLTMRLHTHGFSVALAWWADSCMSSVLLACMTLTVRRRYGVSAYNGLMQLFGAQYLTRYNMVWGKPKSFTNGLSGRSCSPIVIYRFSYMCCRVS